MGHSKGPWYAHLNGRGAYCIKNGMDYDNSPVICARNEWSKREEESEANARLIAAAPDLLEACKAALYEVQGTEIHMLLDAAITKATAQREGE